jgi:hypothetical protein
LIESRKEITEIQGDFESCADILSSGRTSQEVAIEPIKRYKNVDFFPGSSFSKKVWEPLNFMKKWVKKNYSRLFCCHLIQN